MPSRLRLLVWVLPLLLSTWACVGLWVGPRDPRTGAWVVTGDDGAHWDATLILGSDGSGHFDWSSSKGAHGREPVRWRFEADTRTIHLQGSEVIDPVGNIIFATYRAAVSEDGRHMSDGWWGGDNNEEGSWTADWKGEETGG